MSANGRELCRSDFTLFFRLILMRADLSAAISGHTHTRARADNTQARNVCVSSGPCARLCDTVQDSLRKDAGRASGKGFPHDVITGEVWEFSLSLFLFFPPKEVWLTSENKHQGVTNNQNWQSSWCILFIFFNPDGSVFSSISLPRLFLPSLLTHFSLLLL